MVLLPERKIFMFRIGLKKRKQPQKSARRITDKNNNEWLVINEEDFYRLDCYDEQEVMARYKK